MTKRKMKSELLPKGVARKITDSEIKNIKVIVDIWMSDGFFLPQVAKITGYSLRRFRELSDPDHKDYNEKFAEVIEHGNMLAQAHWEGLGLKNAEKDKGNCAMIRFMLERRWRKVYGVNHFENVNMNPVINIKYD